MKRIHPALLLVIVLLVSCAKNEETSPVDIESPDVPLLRNIALAAIAERLPSIPHDQLNYEHTLYQLYRDHMFKQTNEMFSVEFGVKNSMRKVECDGENFFQVDSISVSIHPDGQIDKGGVSSNATRYMSADLNPMRKRETFGSPVWGQPFYPVALNAPLRKPECRQLEGIALRAISRFLPAVNTNDLEFDSLSYFDGYCPGKTNALKRCSITFWVTSTMQERKTEKEVILSGQDVTVQIQPDGRVRKENVTRSPLNFTMNRQSIEEIERKRQDKTSEDTSLRADPHR